MRGLRRWLKRDDQGEVAYEYVEQAAGVTSARVVVWPDGWANVISDRGDFEEFVESAADLAALLAAAGVPTEHADDLWTHFATRNAKH